jgi:hypothetical protein
MVHLRQMVLEVLAPWYFRAPSPRLRGDSGKRVVAEEFHQQADCLGADATTLAQYVTPGN